MSATHNMIPLIFPRREIFEKRFTPVGYFDGLPGRYSSYFGFPFSPFNKVALSAPWKSL